MKTFSYIDLFAGIGGFRMALDSFGGRCLGFSEIDKTAISTYCENYDESTDLNFGDIKKIDSLPSHDILTAGVPCQSWSIAGKRLGFEDDRGQLWNDTLYLLNQSHPKVFIFENVKGLADNKSAMEYILSRISESGYYSIPLLIDASDFGVSQARERIYIVGFREKEYFDKFIAPKVGDAESPCLSDILDDDCVKSSRVVSSRGIGLSVNNQGFNDYFILTDLRDGPTTLHSWQLQETSEKEKHICHLLLKNRRKKKYGPQDGNPLSLKHFQELDGSITEKDLEGLVEKKLLKKKMYSYVLADPGRTDVTEEQSVIMDYYYKNDENWVYPWILRNLPEVKKRRINVDKVLEELYDEGCLTDGEVRYEFKNGKMSRGINGVYRIFLPSARVFPTLVATDSLDYVATENISADTYDEYVEKFIKEIYEKGKFRKITHKEALRLQGFPDTFKLPESRSKWMKLVGNSVAVPVIKKIVEQIILTGVFNQ